MKWRKRLKNLIKSRNQNRRFPKKKQPKKHRKNQKTHQKRRLLKIQNRKIISKNQNKIKITTIIDQIMIVIKSSIREIIMQNGLMKHL